MALSKLEFSAMLASRQREGPGFAPGASRPPAVVAAYSSATIRFRSVCPGRARRA